MGWDGAGSYTRIHNFSADASAGIKILAARMDAEINDIASAIPIAWARDGQNVPTVDMPMGGKKFVNVGAPTSVANYVRVRELIENVPIFMQDVESSADRISVSSQYFTSVSANQAPGDGTKIMVRVKSNKSSAAIYLDGHSANIMYQGGGLIGPALTSGGIYEFTYSSVDGKWQVPVPAGAGRTAAEISAGVTVVNATYPPGNIYRYKSGSLALDATNDWSTAIQAACNVALSGGTTVTIPVASAWTGYGFYRCNSTITLSHGIAIHCDGDLASLYFYGCNGFDIAAGAAFFKISNLHIAANGAPKTHLGINFAGASGNTCNYNYLTNLFMQGWLQAVYLSYTWNTVIDGLVTTDCDNCVRLFGQSVENKIVNSNLVANTGTASVYLAKDVAVTGEGLNIVNTGMASGDYGLYSEGFLSLNLTNCIIDQIQDVGVLLVNVIAFNMSSSWIYSVNYGIEWSDLGTQVDQKASVTGTKIETTAANSRPLFIGANNTGISIATCSLTCGSTGTARCVYVQVAGCEDISVIGCNLDNPHATNKSIFVGTGSNSFRHTACTGVDTVEYFTVPGFTATLNNADTSPTGDIPWTIHGDLVTLQIPAIIAASSSTTAPTLTGIPTALYPLTEQHVSGFATNNSLEVASRYVIATDGTITMHNGTSTTFTAAGTKGSAVCSITYRRF